MPLKPASTFAASRIPIVDSDGLAVPFFTKVLQDWDTKLRNGLNTIGQITQDIPITTKVAGRTEGIGTTLHNLDASGVMLAAGIDFSRAYVNKNTDNIADATGNPLAGGKAAYKALVAFPPTPVTSQWVRGLAAGVFVLGQPAFSDVTGIVTPAQVQALSSLSGQIAMGQLPSAGISAVVNTAKLTVGGANGTMTFTNGVLTAQVQAT